MKYIQSVIQFGQQVSKDNPRLITNMAAESLMESIETIGLKEMPTVFESEKGKFEIVRGHRRFMAIGLLKDRNPKRFEELFGKGIPVLVVKDVTAEEVIELKLDHDGVELLSDPHELQRSANMLFAIGKTEQEVANVLQGLIDRFAPMSSKAKLELKALKDAEALATGDSKILKAQEVKKFIGDYRRGFVQNLHNTYRCPDKVMSALYKKATGQAPEGVKEYLPKLPTGLVTALWKAHKADLELRENGVPKYNKQINGPNFIAKWAEICQKEQAEIAEGADETPRAKAMSAKDMKAEITEGAYRSELGYKLTTHHMGEAVEGLKELDTFAYFGDLIRKYDKASFDQLLKAGKEIEARLIAESDKAKAKETESVKLVSK